MCPVLTGRSRGPADLGVIRGLKPVSGAFPRRLGRRVRMTVLCNSPLPAVFPRPWLQKKEGAVAGANSDKWPPPNQAGSEQDARKRCSEIDRMPHNPAGGHRTYPGRHPKNRSVRQTTLKEAVDLVHEAGIKFTGQGFVYIRVVVGQDVVRYAAIVEIM